MQALPTSGKVVIVLLVISVVLSILILAYDSLLWFDNHLNGHAYGLVAFTVVDVALIFLVFVRPKAGLRYTLIWSAIFFSVMALDPLTAPQIGLTVERFAGYLYGIRPLPPSPGTEVPCPLYCPPLIFSFPALIAVELLLVVTSWKAAKAER